MRNLRTLLALVAGMLIAGSAGATPIVIFNTGLDAGGSPLAGGVADPHWSIIDPLGETAAVREPGYPLPPEGPWMANTATSQWITPDPDGGFGSNSASFTTFTYETTFTLGAFVSASLSGDYASDNQTLAIYLNGVPIGFTPNCADSTADVTCFTMFDSFSVNSGFIVGVNTLRFEVLNGEGPSGLRVEVSGEYDPVPEPGTLLLLGSGLTGLALRRRRSRQQS